MWQGRNKNSYILGALLWTSLNVMAFLDPATTKVFDVKDHLETFVHIQLHSRKRNENVEIPDDRGLTTFFELRKKKQEIAQPTKSELSEGTGFLKSISRWREGKKRKGKENLDGADKAQKAGSKSNGRKNAGARKKKDAEKGAAFELERIRQYQAGIKSEETSSDRITSPDDNSEWALKRFNLVSAAQKLLSAVSNKQKSSKEEWIVVASKTSIAPGALVPISAAGLDLLLVASKDGSALHCIANSCSHLGTPLEIGTLERRPVEIADDEADNVNERPSNVQENYLAKLLTQDGCEDCIVCPLHKTAFALESGEVRGVSVLNFPSHQLLILS